MLHQCICALPWSVACTTRRPRPESGSTRATCALVRQPATKRGKRGVAAKYLQWFVIETTARVCERVVCCFGLFSLSWYCLYPYHIVHVNSHLLYNKISYIFAQANAAGTLRAACTPGTLGIDATTMGKHGVTPLGDLASIICTICFLLMHGLACLFHLWLIYLLYKFFIC